MPDPHSDDAPSSAFRPWLWALVGTAALVVAVAVIKSVRVGEPAWDTFLAAGVILCITAVLCHRNGSDCAWGSPCSPSPWPSCKSSSSSPDCHSVSEQRHPEPCTMPLRQPLLLALVLLTAGLTGCADAELEPAGNDSSEFVASCLAAVPEATGEMCTCAQSEAREHMSEDGYAMFLISFLPDRDARADEIMAREGFHVDIERFTLAMLDVMEACGFGALPAN